MDATVAARSATTALLLAAATVVGCDSDAPRASVPSPAPTGPTERVLPSQLAFVGAARCGSCHQEALERWRASDHFHSLELPSEASVRGAFDGRSVRHGRFRTTFTRRGDAFVVRTDGPESALEDYPIAYVVGVRPLQQYVVTMERGHLQSLPWLWDARPSSEGGERWYHLYGDDVADARDPLHWTRPAQNYNYVCAECHSTALDRGYDAASDTFETRWAEIDVACEACHGPGEAHVAWATDGVPYAGHGLRVALAASTPWEMDPSTGSARPHPRDDRQIEACAPCHSRRTPLANGPRAGDAFLDDFLPELLRAGLYTPDGQILDEVYVWGSFVQSRMFHAGVRCSDCHEPHGLALRAPGNALCARCHDPARFDGPGHHHHASGSPAAECVACHMPTRVYMGVDVRRDHSLRVPRPDLAARFGTPDPCRSCHEASRVEARIPTAEGWLTFSPPVHLSEALAMGRTDAVWAFDALAHLSADASAPAIARATALELLADLPRQRLLALVRDAARSDDALVRYGATRAAEGLPPPLRAELLAPIADDPVRAVRVGVARALSTVDLASLPARDRQAVEAAFATFRAAMAVSASRSETWVTLGTFEAERGRSDAAEEAYRHALRLDPQNEAARLNLADLLRARGDDAGAEAELRALLRDSPRSAEAEHALGLLEVRRGDLDAALSHLARASEERPESARFLYVHAVALASAGRRSEAIAELRAGFARHPADADLGLALATYLRQEGAVDEAGRIAVEVLAHHPEHPEARQLAATAR